MMSRRAVVGFLALLLIGLLLVGAAFEIGRRWPLEGLQQLVFGPPPIPAPWQEFAPNVHPRFEGARAVVGNRLYVIGGFESRQIEATNRVDILDLESATWSRGADLPSKITHVNTVVLGDTVWLAGGFVGDHPGRATSNVWRYLTTEDRWEAGPALPAPRGGGGLVARGDTLHYMGGWFPDRNTDSPDHWVLFPDSSTWQARAPLPSPRGHFVVVAWRGQLYAIGGNHQHDPVALDVSLVHRYDPALDRWEERPSLPFAVSHQEATAEFWRGLLLIAGGRGRASGAENMDAILAVDLDSGWTIPVARLPEARLGAVMTIRNDSMIVGFGGERGIFPSTVPVTIAPIFDTWHRGADLPSALGEVSAVLLGDRVFVVGHSSATTHAYNPQSGMWDPPGRWESRPAAGNHHAAEAWNGKLVLIGGFDAWSQGQLQVFDPASGHWTVGPALPFLAGSSASAVIDGRLFVAGGIVADATTGRAAVLDSLGGSWQPIAEMPRPRNHAASGTDGKRLYVFGGRGPGSGDANVVADGFDDVQIYDPATGRWTVSDGSPGAPQPLPQARGGMGKAVWLNGEFWVIGGETVSGDGATSRKVYARVDIYDPVANRWRTGPPLNVARHGSFPVVDRGRILVMGGGDRAGESSSTIVEVIWPTPPR